MVCIVYIVYSICCSPMCYTQGAGGTAGKWKNENELKEKPIHFLGNTLPCVCQI